MRTLDTAVVPFAAATATVALVVLGAGRDRAVSVNDQRAGTRRHAVERNGRLRRRTAVRARSPTPWAQTRMWLYAARRLGGRPGVPLIDVTYDESLPPDVLRRLGAALPEAVSEAVDCPEDPWIGPPAPGDFDIRFRSRGALDIGDLNCVIEVRTKLFSSREQDKHRRVEVIRERLTSLFGPYSFGVWLILAEGAWTQSDSDR